MNRIPIALFRNRAQAQPVQERLAKAGIATTIEGEGWLQRLWFVSAEAAGVRLEVAADQFEQAESLLKTWDSTSVLQAIRCPECQSLLVDYPQVAHHSALTNLAAGLLAEIGLVEKDYYCEHCHFTWPREEAKNVHPRKHLAPYYFIEGVEPAKPGRGSLGPKPTE